MRMLFVVPLLGFMSFSLAAFVPHSVDTSQRGMIYGHLRYSQPVDQVEFSPLSGIRRSTARVLPNGDFYLADMAPGHYVITRARSNGVWRDLGSDRGVRELAVLVEAGAINYAGSWALSGSGTDLQVVATERPAPDVLLKRLRYSLRGTGWDKQIP